MSTIRRMLTVVVAMAVAVMTGTAHADTWTNENGVVWTYTVTNGYAVIGDGANSAISGDTSGNLTVPSTLSGYPVVEIASYAFDFCYKLTSVTIPNSVTSIGDGAFDYCLGLTSVTIPNGVTSIGKFAFFSCTNLTSVKIGATSIGDDAFYNCRGLTNVIISEGVTSIGHTAFIGCRGLTTMTIPEGVTNIGWQAFSSCTALTSVVLPSSLTNLEWGTFAYCDNLMSIEVAQDNPAYSSVGGLLLTKDLKTLVHGVNGNVAIPAGVTTIDFWAFPDLRGLTSVTIPDGVREIRSCAFAGCTGLKSVTIPASVWYIGQDAFEDCTNLVSVRFESLATVADSWRWNSKYGNVLPTENEMTVTVDDLPEVQAHCGRISRNQTWDKNRVHLVLGDVSVDAGVRLSISSGAVVKFMPGTALSIADGGICEAYGVVFTHVNDDTVGDDTLRDGEKTSAVTGDYALDGNILDDDMTEYRFVASPPTSCIASDITVETKLRGYCTYIVSNSVTVARGATLTLQPGTVIKFTSGCSLVVNGTLNAQGIRAAPIVFTSINDDTYGGKTEGSTSNPACNDWKYVMVSGNAVFEHTLFLYGGGASNSRESGMLVGELDGTISLKECILAHALYDGIFSRASITAENTIIYDCDRGVNTCGGKGVFKNCVVDSCRWGVMAEGGRGEYYNCIITRYYPSKAWPTGWGAAFWSGGLKVQNCCIWSPAAGTEVFRSAPSVVQSGNIFVDPLFFDPDSANYRIKSTSPCVDAADGYVAPEKDYYGSPRMNVEIVRDSGTASANGAVPDIGIYEVPGDGVIPSADLVVTDVTAPESLTIGENVEVSWTVKNVGEVTTSGSWRDEIELVAANGQVFSMWTSISQADVQPGESTNFHATVTVPAAPEGAVQVRVTANKQQDLFEAMRSENNVGTTAATLNAPTLAVPSDGTATMVTLGGDSDVGFVLDGGGAVATQGGVLVIRGTGEIDAWLGNGSIAAKDNAIRTAVQISDDTWILQIPAGSEPRVTVRNDGESEVAAQLSLEVGGFFLLDTGKKSAANSGVVSVPFFGNGFSDSLACWLERGGQRVEASDLKVESSVSALATFDVTGCEARDWMLHVKKGTDEASAVLLTLTQSRIGAKWWCKVNVLKTIRSGRVYVGSIEYGNSGDTAMPAPYLHVVAKDGTLIRLNEADAWTDSTELMAISSVYPASSLKPGESGKVEFFYKTTGSRVLVNCDYTLSDAEPFPWDTNSQYMRPSWATDEMWRLALATLKSNVGATWNDFLQRMRDNADHLMKLGYRTERLDRLWQMVINEALGSDHAVQTLAGGTDLARSGRGLGLSFSRTYGAAMFRRLKTGVFGYGWTDNYSTCAELVDPTTLAFHLPSGATYQFHKVNGKWTSEDARDKTILAETTSAYTLTYKSGTVQTVAKLNMRTSSICDNQGNELLFSYSGTQLQKVQHSDGQSLTFTYSGNKLASVTDDQGRMVSYGYTGDLLTSVTAFNGLVTRYVYHAADSTPLSRALTQIVCPDGTTKDYTYDDQGRVATVSVNGNQFTTEIVRGACGSYSVIAPNGGVTEVTVGASGETLKTVNALGQIVQQKYTTDTQLESVIAPSGKRNKITYNTDGAPVVSLSASGATTAFSYEPDFDNLASVTDAKGHAISYGYDDKGRGNSISYVDGSMSSLEYNEKGDVMRATNRRGETIEYEYDAEGNLVKKTWPNGRTFTLAYDAKGNVTNAADSVTGAVAMEYDANERLTRIVYPKGRGFTYTYDAVGRVTERTMLGGSQFTATASATQRYTYDSLGRLATVTDGDGNPYLTNAYDLTTGWLITQTYGNGTVVSNAYDILGRTVGIYHLGGSPSSATVLAFFEYSYDADGKCISQTTAEGTESYTYDADGQLTAVTYPDGTSETFTYDAVGNRITANTTTYTVNNLNQYTTLRDSASPRELNLKYDLDGNMTRKGDTRYTYDTLNRLVAVTNEAENIRWSCEYDVFGNRVSVTENGTTTERLFVQGALPSVAAEYNGDTLAKSHILVGAVRLATHNSPTPNSPTLYYHADLLGSARLLTDGTGATKGTRSFKAFGETRTSTGEATDAGYVGTLGVETDSNGLLFMRNRYYDAGMGRFVQMDPMGLEAGDVNMYRYCMNDVVMYIDVTGTKFTLCGFLDYWEKSTYWTDVWDDLKTGMKIGVQTFAPMIPGGWGLAGALGVGVWQNLEADTPEGRFDASLNGGVNVLNSLYNNGAVAASETKKRSFQALFGKTDGVLGGGKYEKFGIINWINVGSGLGRAINTGIERDRKRTGR